MKITVFKKHTEMKIYQLGMKINGKAFYRVSQGQVATTLQLKLTEFFLQKVQA